MLTTRPAWLTMADEHMALENLELRDRVADLLAERDSYREWFQHALHALHHVTAERDRQRQTIGELRAVLRNLTCDRITSDNGERRAA